MNEAYNLERQTALENSIDPTGKKWEIKGERGSSLVHARPNPDRSDAQIPKAFGGRWTSRSVLLEKIDVWLGQQWDASERAAQKLARRAHAESVEEITEEAVVKQTAQESIESLSEEIKAELGDVIALVPDYLAMTFAELRAIATPLGVKGTSKAVLIEGIETAKAVS